jgi:hypothetical protein
MEFFHVVKAIVYMYIYKFFGREGQNLEETTQKDPTYFVLFEYHFVVFVLLQLLFEI